MWSSLSELGSCIYLVSVSGTSTQPAAQVSVWSQQKGLPIIRRVNSSTVTTDTRSICGFPYMVLLSSPVLTGLLLCVGGWVIDELAIG